MNVARNSESIEYQIIERQIVFADVYYNTFADRVIKALMKYNLGNINNYMQKPISKFKWKRKIKDITNAYWMDKCIKDKKEKSSLQYLELQDKPLGNAHNVWKSVQNNSNDVKAAEVKVRLLTQTYMLQSRKAKLNLNRVSSLCLLCKKEEEDISHFILKCTKLEKIRSKYIKKYEEILNSIGKDIFQNMQRQGQMLQLVLDCTSKTLHLHLKSDIYQRLETVSRNMCFELQKERMKTVE